MGAHAKQAQASQAAMELLHTELEVVQARCRRDVGEM